VLRQTKSCGPKPIYVSESAPGGCEQTCYHPPDRNFAHGLPFDPNIICSDGGEGSRRIPFELPRQKGNDAEVGSNWMWGRDERLVYW
jgi:hypothetical protein